MTNITYIICSILSFVPAIVLHEVAHGFVAFKCGDLTAKSQGRLSINPLKHIDPFGTVLMPLILMLSGLPVFGYAKPVPYNPLRFRNMKRGELLTGLAGPAMNLLLALIASALAWILLPYAEQVYGTSPLPLNIFEIFYGTFIPMFTLINLYLMFFNLLPVPPLDGSSIIGYFIPPKYLPTYYKIQQYALPVFMIVVIVLPMILNFNPIGIYLDVTAGNLMTILNPLFA